MGSALGSVATEGSTVSQMPTLHSGLYYALELHGTATCDAR